MYTMPARIRRCRTVCGLSQAALGARLGVRRSAVAQWESTNGTSPSLQHLSQLATVTGVCFEWLATGRGPMQPEAGVVEPTVTVGDFAKDEIESRVLSSIRLLSYRHRLMACRIVESMLA